MSGAGRGLRLLPREALLRTGEVDHADWNYRPLLGRVMRLRFGLAAGLLGGARYGRLLEIGYGSGVLMPELARHCGELYGIDVHPDHAAVAEVLAGQGVGARLFSGSATRMPFADDFFDCAVAVSALEFVEDLGAACAEIGRVLRPAGSLVVVTPGYSPVADLGLRVLTGKRARDDFGERRRLIIPTLLEHFSIERRRTAPPFAGPLVRLYTALKLRPLARGGAGGGRGKED